MAVRRAALVGCGDVSGIHFEAIDAIDDIQLVAVADVDQTRRQAAMRRMDVPGFASVADMLDGVGDIDVVHVTTPHHQHANVTIPCLEAGIHVIQEKPLAHTLADAQRIVDAAAASGAKIGICFQNRYNVSSVQLKRILDAGQLGEILGAVAQLAWTRTPTYYEARPWRGTWEGSGGGLLINQAIHTLDLIAWLGGPVAGISGHASQRKFAGVTEVEDTAEALFTHTNGTHTSFYATLTSPINRPVEYQIVGTDGTATIRDGLTVTMADGHSLHYPERRAPSVGRAYWGVSHEILIRDFYARLDDPAPFWISPTVAMTSLRMLKTIYDQTPGLESHNYTFE